MSSRSENTSRRLAELREEFDLSFSRPPARVDTRWEVLLRLRVAGTALTVPLERLSGLHILARVVALPGSPAGLLGLVGLRGQLVAVHDLAYRLGLPSDEKPHWMVLCGGERRMGLAVGGFEGQLRVTPEQIQPNAGEAPRPYLRASVARPDAPPLPVLDVDALVKDLLDGAAAPRNTR
ncbi:chemotaxis protein CheW [Stigmatella erecta]|uniref:Purine-binding chemotaxis protein CheW n=1 Tax=Stigmatella erecta TaxID=83460 RepID=A0A1I0IXV1_9BACT|nr:chemotaxis protein CheW [Stigmatella erecta]SEU02246.1 purine-binding chemotaxis protein CheW [Stigmatella erecta]